MDFELSDEQNMLKDSVDRFVLDNYDSASRAKLAATELGYSADNWNMFAELGWLGMPFSEEDGGYGGTPVETAVMMECMGKGLVLEPFLSTVILGGGLIATAGNTAQKEEIIPAIIEGKMKLAFGYAEAQSRFNLSDVETTAVKSGDGYIINGHKAVVYHGTSADKVIISARTSGDTRDEDGVSLFIIDQDMAGMSRRDYPTVDASRAADFTFEDVSVPASCLLGEEGKAGPVIENVINTAISAICAEAVGAMQASNEITNEYIKTRKQFGVPIGKFQVLQHKMVDMFMEAEQSKSMSDMAAMKLQDAGDDAAKAVSATKAQIGAAAKFVGQNSIQLHGGMGMTDEYSIGHYFKRLTMIEMLFGNTDYHVKKFQQL